MTLKLYELTDQYVGILKWLDEAEDPEPMADLLAAIKDTFDDKAENVGKLIKTLTAEKEAVSFERTRLSKRERALDHKIDWLKEYVKGALITVGRTKVGTVVKLSLRTNPPSVVVIDEEMVPAIFRNVVTEIKVDKKGILQAWKDNAPAVPGVNIITDKVSLQVR